MKCIVFAAAYEAIITKKELQITGVPKNNPLVCLIARIMNTAPSRVKSFMLVTQVTHHNYSTA